MAYQLTFFCGGVGEDTGAGAVDRMLAAMPENGPPLFAEMLGTPGEPTQALWLSTRAGGEAFDSLLLEMRVGVRPNAEHVIAVDPDDEHGVWGSDLVVVLTLSGERTDWALVDRVWTALASLGAVVPWDEMSGFEHASEPRQPLAADDSA